MLHILNILGVAVFAVSGALEAARRRMDVFGAVVIALVTALGGGTLRDVILRHGPVFWVADSTDVVVVTLAAVAAFFAAGGLDRWPRLLLVADAGGLAVFSVIGVQKALAAGVSPVVALVMGVITGVAGGIVRDILCNEVPLVLRREIYATAALAGGALFLLLRHLGIPDSLNTLWSALLVLGVRLIAVRLDLALPCYPAKILASP